MKYRKIGPSFLFSIAVALFVALAGASDFITRHKTPISNASTCGDCHQAPQLGGSSPTTVTRAGHLKSGKYVPGPNGGLVHSRSGNQTVSRIPADENIRGLRVSLNLLGDGYVEAIPDETLRAIADYQRRTTNGVIHGQVIEAPLLEANPKARQIVPQHIGRFGWKSQHATLVSASADALRNELGVPNTLYIHPLVPEGGKAVKGLDSKISETSSSIVMADAEIQDFVRFIRASEPIAQDADVAKTPAVQSGAQLFEKIGCGICHVSSLQTAPARTVIVGTTITGATSNDGPYKVPEQLGGKTIHPYSDYLLHDVGTGDGIVQTANPSGIDLSPQAQATANQFRTAPLWGVRYRKWMMHDGQTKTYDQAITRHGGEARHVIEKYKCLSPVEQSQILALLDSL